jgi:hypothetical protein
MVVDYVSALVVRNVLRVQPNFASLMEEGGAVPFLDVTRVLETSFFVLRKCFGVLCACCDTSVVLFFTLSDVFCLTCVSFFLCYLKGTVVGSDVPLKGVRDLRLEDLVIVLLTEVVAVVQLKVAPSQLKVAQTIVSNTVEVKNVSIWDVKRLLEAAPSIALQ